MNSPPQLSIRVLLDGWHRFCATGHQAAGGQLQASNLSGFLRGD